MEERKKESSFRDILIVLFKHKFKIMALFLAAVIVSPVAHLAFVRHYTLYEASSVLMIRYGREYTRPNLGGEPTTLHVSLPEIVNSEIAILSSRDLKEKVINTLGSQYIYPQVSKPGSQGMPATDVAILLFNKGMTVQGIHNSNLITVSFRHVNPVIAAAVLNQLVESYQEKRLEILNDSKPVAFLEQKVAEYRQKLKETQSQLESFRRENQIVSFDDQRNLLLQEHMKLDLTVKATQTQVKELSEKLLSLESQTKTISATVPISQEKDPASQAEFLLLTLQQKEQELMAKYMDINPQITGVRNQIKLTVAFIESQRKQKGGGRGAASELYQGLQRDIITTRADLSVMTVRSNDLQKQLQELDHDLQSFDRQEETFRDLRRDWATSEANYQTYLSKLEEARISAEMDKQKMTSVSVIERAAVPLVPVSPKQTLPYFVAIAALAGLGAGIGLAFIREFFRQGYHTRQKVEKSLGLPVLIVIPHQSV
jgi:uncharacterized protein involved in exopolysaccharide biosynthesis